MKSLFPTIDGDDGLSDLHSKLQDHISQIVRMTRTLEAEKSRGRMVLLRFVEKLLKYASDASNTLPNGGPLHLPTSANALAAEILSDQMAAMIRGDLYEVISDFTTWQNSELDVLREKIKIAAKVGVIVRRVFSRFDYDEANMTADEASEILLKHWQIAEAYPTYELAVSPYPSYEHVGTFTFGKDAEPISFRPPKW